MFGSLKIAMVAILITGIEGWYVCNEVKIR